MLLPGGERREWIKPIMFSGGIGAMDDQHTMKMTPEVGKKRINSSIFIPGYLRFFHNIFPELHIIFYNLKFRYFSPCTLISQDIVLGMF